MISKFLILPVLFATLLAAHAAKLPDGFSEEKIATGLDPVTMAFSPDGRLFLCEKPGLLRVVSGKEMLKEPALDISAKVDGWNERGLMSVCFDPEFEENGWIYVFYTHNRDPEDNERESSNNRISRFTMKGDIADPGSEEVILELNNLSKAGIHNGGGLAFGKDGMLYVGTGENGLAPNSQDPGNLLGKLLRINKDGSIPSDNPNYQSYDGNNRAIVAMGFRNAFHIAVQPGSGLLYSNDVGANFEEIEAYDTSAKPVALNYGWPEIDGPAKDGTTPEGYREAAYPYDHGSGKGKAICGGDFLNPSKPGAEGFPDVLIGKYFFGDYAGWIKYIDPAEPGIRHDFADGINRALDIATAPDGTLWYIERNGIAGGSIEANSASEDGILWRISWKGGDYVPVEEKVATHDELPATLSAAGIFTDENLTPVEGAVAYSLNSSIWADGAEISRWVILPEGGKVKFSPTEDYKWPGGTKFFQHFEIVTDAAKGTRRRLETRLLVLDETGAFGYGATYRWRADGKDADLVEDWGAEVTMKITDAEGMHPRADLDLSRARPLLSVPYAECRLRAGSEDPPTRCSSAAGLEQPGDVFQCA